MIAVTLAGLPMTTPVVAASGCAATGAATRQQSVPLGLGALVTRSITLAPQPGGPLPRLVESPAGLVNALGVPGPGIDAFVRSELPVLLDTGVPVIVSIWSQQPAEAGKVAQILRQVDGLAGIEVNLSHPSAAAPDPAATVHQVRRNTATQLPVFAKLGPENVVPTARACLGAGADGLSLINAVPGLAVDPATQRPALGGVVGGLSGPAIRPIAMRAVWQVREAFPDVPIIASGGVMTGADALGFLLAGANCVAIGSVLLNDPAAGQRITRELAAELGDRDVASVCGAAHLEGGRHG